MSRLRSSIHDTGLLPRLLVAEVVVLALLFVGGVLLINQMAGSLRQNIKEERLLLGRAFAEDLDTSLDHAVTELQQLGVWYQRAVAMSEPAEIQGAVDFILGESTMFTRGILIVEPDGEVLGADQRHRGAVEIDLRRYWPGLWDQHGRSPQVSTAAFSVQGQASPSVAIAVPIGGEGGRGYVVGLLDTVDSYPARLVERATHLGGSGHADIVNRDGVDLFSTERVHLLLSSDHPASYRELLSEGGSVISELPQQEDALSDGESHLMAFVPLETVPWAVATGTTVSEAYSPVRQLWYGGLGLLTLFIGLAFAATVFVSRRLVRPVKALSSAARNVAEGDRTVSVRIPWGGEIGELARSLEIMRLHLQAWGSELETQVEERTSQLEERNRELGALYEMVQKKEKQLRALLAKVLGAQEDERKRVSRDLHDGIGQALSALSMGLERLEQAGPGRWPQLREQAEALKDLSTSALSDLRRLTIALRPAALGDLGLVPAIRRYAQLYLGDADIGFQVTEEGLDARIDPSLETVVYRVVQEAINNVARHSRASRVTIHLRSVGGRLAVTVEDDGRGFDVAVGASRRGVGFQGMEERASLVEGKLAVDSEPGRGTTVRLEIPLPERVQMPGHA